MLLITSRLLLTARAWDIEGLDRLVIFVHLGNGEIEDFEAGTHRRISLHARRNCYVNVVLRFVR